MKFSCNNHKPVFIIYLGILIIGLLIISNIVRPKDYEIYDMQTVKMESRCITNEKSNSLDVLFIGNSIAYSAFSPLHFWKESGFTSYVLATPGQRLCDTYAIVNNALKTQSPKVIVLETNSFYRDIGIYQNEKDYIFNLYAKIFPLLQYHSFYKSESDSTYYEKNSFYKGFQPSEVSYAMQNPFSEHINRELKEELIPKANLKYLDMLCTICKKNNIILVLISVPTINNWDYGRHLGIEKWAKQQHLGYMDMNLLPDQGGIDWTRDTRDGGDHMNTYGARIVSNFVADYIKKNIVLPDHRSDPEYASWNNDCKSVKIY